MLRPARHAGLLIGLPMGSAIWLLSPFITGLREPWDAESGYYPGALLAAGVCGGLVAPRHWISVAIGIFAGQLAVLLGGVILQPANGGLWPLGVLFLAAYSLLALAGAALGAGVRRFRRRMRP
jgi:hypothetical protein